MFKQLNAAELILAVKNAVELGTGVNCYDVVPRNAPAPFYYIELTSYSPQNTKNCFITQYNVNVHTICTVNASHVKLLKMLADLEEALTDDIILPDGFQMYRQVSGGTASIFEETEASEIHAVTAFQFYVSYGYKVKEIS